MRTPARTARSTARPIADGTGAARGSGSAPHRGSGQGPGSEALLRLRHVESDAAGATIAIHAVLGAGTASTDGPVEWQQESLVDDGLTVARIRATGAVRVHVARSTELVVVAVRSGEVELHEQGAALRLGPGEIALIPLGASLSLAWTSARLDLFSIPPTPLARLLGVGTAEVRLQAPRRLPRTPALKEYFDRTVRLLLDHTFEAAEVYEADLIRASAIALLAAVVVEAFDLVNRTEQATDRDDAVIRRAVVFMRRHLRDPVSIPEIAQVAGVSVRGLQLVFRRRLDTTPLMHLRQLRLEAARQQLLRESGSATTVAAVATSYGYSNPARFSTHYREAFDRSPVSDLAAPAEDAGPAPGTRKERR